MTDNLKPCPFCGGDAAKLYLPTCTERSRYDPLDRAYPVVRCGVCLAEMAGDNFDQSGKSATAGWNRRDDATPSATPSDTGAAVRAEELWPFQSRVQPWMLACFGPEIAADTVERNHRFLEEALELVQACGCTKDEAHQLVEYVYGRPVGEKAQEVGGVMVTLAALCLAQGLDMHAAAETELARIWTKVEQIRAKQAAKPKGSPLPEAPALSSLPQPAPAWTAVREALEKAARIVENWSLPTIQAPSMWLVDKAGIAAEIRQLAASDAALSQQGQQGWRPTHQHRKGGLYRVITRAELEADLSPVVVYDDANGRVWVRPAAEFDDGRFAPLPTPPAPTGGEG